MPQTNLTFAPQEFDNTTFSFQWSSLGTMSLQSGYQNLSLDTSPTLADQILLIRTPQVSDNSTNNSASINVTQLSTTKYLINVDAQSPFFLDFGDSFDASWKLMDSNGTAFQHFQANFLANTYYVDKAGTYSLTLEYVKQGPYELGLYASLSIFILLFTVAVYLSVSYHIKKRLK